MKHILPRVLAFLVILSLLGSLMSCGSFGAAKVTNAEELHKATDGGEIEVTNGSVSKYKGVKKNIEIQNDFTISTDDPFFTEAVANFKLAEYVPGRMMQNSTINGNGHTITVTGTADGSLGRYSTGLFARLMDCEVKDLHVVYDLDVKLSASKNGMGGIAAVAKNCTFTNCTVTYNKSVSLSGYRAGGMVGLFSGTMKDCSVTGDFEVSMEHFGGLIGGVDGATVQNVSVKGSLTAENLRKAEVGALFGWMKGEASNATVTLSGFSVSGKTDKWTNYDAYCGALVGKLYGNLHDAVVELSEDATVSATELSDGKFHTNMHTGIVTGWADKDAKIDNVFIDAMDGHKPNLSFPEGACDIALGVYKNESSAVGTIYYAEDDFIHQHIERVRDLAAPERLLNSNDLLYTFTMSGKPCSVTVCRDEPMENVYQVTSLILKLVDTEYALTTRIDDHPSSPSYTVTEDGFVYTVTLNTEGSFVDVSKTMDQCITDGVTFVTDYAQVSLTGNAFTTDESGKPILK